MALLGTVTRRVVVGRKSNEALVCRYAVLYWREAAWGDGLIGVRREMTQLGTYLSGELLSDPNTVLLVFIHATAALVR